MTDAVSIVNYFGTKALEYFLKITSTARIPKRSTLDINFLYNTITYK